MVRGGAIKTLLAGWKRERYLDRAIAMLLENPDEDWMVCSDAAFALAQYARYTAREQDRIARVLVGALKSDPEREVQAASYGALLSMLAPDREPPLADEFDRDRDVDWPLLAPYV